MLVGTDKHQTVWLLSTRYFRAPLCTECKGVCERLYDMGARTEKMLQASGPETDPVVARGATTMGTMNFACTAVS